MLWYHGILNPRFLFRISNLWLIFIRIDINVKLQKMCKVLFSQSFCNTQLECNTNGISKFRGKFFCITFLYYPSTFIVSLGVLLISRLDIWIPDSLANGCLMFKFATSKLFWPVQIWLLHEFLWIWWIALTQQQC